MAKKSQPKRTPAPPPPPPRELSDWVIIANGQTVNVSVHDVESYSGTLMAMRDGEVVEIFAPGAWTRATKVVVEPT
jgi:ASC-1-like (ASCH) protein